MSNREVHKTSCWTLCLCMIRLSTSLKSLVKGRSLLWMGKPRPCFFHLLKFLRRSYPQECCFLNLFLLGPIILLYTLG